MILQPGSKVPLPRFDLPLVSIMVALGKPEGAGRLRFESADPEVPPTIEPQLLEHPRDRRDMAEGVRRAFEVSQTPEARAVTRVVWPPARDLNDRSRLEERVMTTCDSGYHPCGTVPMGGDDDPRAACDQWGRVRRTKGLRVGDASLFPTIPSANIHLTVLMVAERIARHI